MVGLCYGELPGSVRYAGSARCGQSLHASVAPTHPDGAAAHVGPRKSAVDGPGGTGSTTWREHRPARHDHRVDAPLLERDAELAVITEALDPGLRRNRFGRAGVR